MRALWDYRCTLTDYSEPEADEEERLKAWLVQFTDELESASSLNLDDALKDFSGDTTLPKLRASIAADLIAEKPDVALDHVHTYCVKRFRNLLSARGQPTDATVPLNALFGAYGKILRDEGAVSAFAQPTLRVQHRLFDGLNQARNKRSFAHDNELLTVSEAQYIVDFVLVSLTFIERIEAARKTTKPQNAGDIPF